MTGLEKLHRGAHVVPGCLLRAVHYDTGSSLAEWFIALPDDRSEPKSYIAVYRINAMQMVANEFPIPDNSGFQVDANWRVPPECPSRCRTVKQVAKSAQAASVEDLVLEAEPNSIPF